MVALKTSLLGTLRHSNKEREEEDENVPPWLEVATPN